MSSSKIKNRQEESMPLWDSVQRSLEKASQEAARIAKTQRLRSAIDGLSRQVNTQQTMIFNRTMDLFLAGQLTQAELLPLCQELAHFQQQLNQAQFELKQLQNSQAGAAGQAQSNTSNQSPPAGEVGDGPFPMLYPPATEEQAQSIYTPPGFQAYLDSTQGSTVPPPPPGVEAGTVGNLGGNLETVLMTPAGAPAAPLEADRQLCQVCQAELSPKVAFCHNCGAPVQDVYASHSPTARAGKPGDMSVQSAEAGSGTAAQEAQGNEGV
jgi:hypothetical protein